MERLLDSLERNATHWASECERRGRQVERARGGEFGCDAMPCVALAILTLTNEKRLGGRLLLYCTVMLGKVYLLWKLILARSSGAMVVLASAPATAPASSEVTILFWFDTCAHAPNTAVSSGHLVCVRTACTSTFVVLVLSYVSRDAPMMGCYLNFCKRLHQLPSDPTKHRAIKVTPAHRSISACNTCVIARCTNQTPKAMKFNEFINLHEHNICEKTADILPP